MNHLTVHIKHVSAPHCHKKLSPNSWIKQHLRQKAQDEGLSSLCLLGGTQQLCLHWVTNMFPTCQLARLSAQEPSKFGLSTQISVTLNMKKIATLISYQLTRPTVGLWGQSHMYHAAECRCMTFEPWSWFHTVAHKRVSKKNVEGRWITAFKLRFIAQNEENSVTLTTFIPSLAKLTIA